MLGGRVCPLTRHVVASVQTLVLSFSSHTVPTSCCFHHPVPHRRHLGSFENQNNSFLLFFFYLWVLLLPTPKSSQAWDMSKLGGISMPLLTSSVALGSDLASLNSLAMSEEGIRSP